MAEFDQEALSVKEQTLERHQEEVDSFVQQLEESIPQ